ncbi:MAG: tetratricopeptide repeat protein, partial [Bacteroidota bacterium]
MAHLHRQHIGLYTMTVSCAHVCRRRSVALRFWTGALLLSAFQLVMATPSPEDSARITAALDQGYTLVGEEKWQQAIGLLLRNAQDADSVDHRTGFLESYYIIAYAQVQNGTINQFIDFLPQIQPWLSYDDELSSDLLLAIGSGYRKRGRLDLAMSFYEQTMDRILEDYPDNLTSLMAAYNNQGIIYRVLGDYDQAELLYRQSLQLAEEFTYPTRTRARAINNIGMVRRFQQDLDGATEYYLTALHLLEEEPKRNKRLRASIQENLAIALLEASDTNAPEALQALREAEQLRKRTDPQLGTTFKHFATAFQKMGKLEEALSYLQKAEAHWQQATPYKSTNKALIYLNRGKILQEKGKLWEAVQAYQQAIIQLVDHFDAEAPETYPQFQMVHVEKDLLEALQSKADCYAALYQMEAKPQHLRLAWQGYDLSIQLVDSLRSQYITDDAKLFLREKLTPLYETAIQTALTMSELEASVPWKATAYEYVLKSKAAVLRESLAQSYYAADQSDSIRLTAQGLKMRITEVKQAWEEAANDSLRAQA